MDKEENLVQAHRAKKDHSNLAQVQTRDPWTSLSIAVILARLVSGFREADTIPRDSAALFVSTMFGLSSKVSSCLCAKEFEKQQFPVTSCSM
uniref:Uncharacterized protein n=1 Tax=Steinernema glaseri TaxID=37863 RepID=A0A1I7YVM7_9BILA